MKKITCPRRGRTTSLLAVLVGVALSAAACGGESAPGVASVGASTSTAQASSTAGTTTGTNSIAEYRAALAYVNCMRAHGEPDIPDPAANGTVNVNFASGGKDGAPVSNGIERMSPEYVSADKTCRPLLPGGAPTPAQTQQALAKALRYSQCMRGHGVRTFPDPNPTNPGVVHLLGVDPNSPQYQSAKKACAALVPGNGSK